MYNKKKIVFGVSSPVIKKSNFFFSLFWLKNPSRSIQNIYVKHKRDIHEISRYSTVMSSGLICMILLPPLGRPHSILDSLLFPYSTLMRLFHIFFEHVSHSSYTDCKIEGGCGARTVVSNSCFMAFIDLIQLGQIARRGTRPFHYFRTAFD